MGFVGTFEHYYLLKPLTPKCSQNKILAVKNLWNSVRTSVFGEKYRNTSVGLLVHMKSLEFASEINWPLAVVATIQGHNEISENLFDEDHHTDILAATQQTIMGLNSSWNRIDSSLSSNFWNYPFW